MSTAPEERRAGLLVGERVVTRRCQHWLVPIGHLLASAPLMLAALFAVLLAADSLGPGWWIVSLLAGLAVAGGWVAIPVARWACWTVTLTDRRVIVARGALVSVRTAVRYEAIQTIEVRQSPLGRVLRYGAVEIGAVGGGRVTLGRFPLRVLEDELLIAMAAPTRGPAG